LIVTYDTLEQYRKEKSSVDYELIPLAPTCPGLEPDSTKKVPAEIDEDLPF